MCASVGGAGGEAVVRCRGYDGDERRATASVGMDQQFSGECPPSTLPALVPITQQRPTDRPGLQWGRGELRPAPFAPAVTIAPELQLTPPDFSMEGQFRPPNTEADLAGLRAAGAVAAAVLDEACKAVAPGVTTEEIDAVAHAACRELRTISTLLPLQHLAYRTPTCGQSWLFNHRAVLTDRKSVV